MKIKKAFNVSEDTVIIEHYYNPLGSGDWYLIEKKKDDRIMYFVCIVLFEKKLSLETLKKKDLLGKRLPFGLKIKRNTSFKKITVHCLMKKLGI